MSDDLDFHDVDTGEGWLGDAPWLLGICILVLIVLVLASPRLLWEWWRFCRSQR